MQDLRHYASQDVEKLESMIQLDDLLGVIDYRVETVQRGSGKWKCFCPIHQEKVFRSLVIDPSKRTFRCSFTQCQGHRGGSLLDLYRMATGKSEVETVKFWSSRLKCPVSTKAKKPPAKAEISVPLVKPKPVEPAEYDDAQVKDLFEADVRVERPQESEEEDVAAEVDLGLQPREAEPVLPVEEPPADVEFEEPAGAPSPTAAPALPTAEQFVLDVKHALARGSLEEAERLLEEALRHHEEHPELLHTRALLLQKKGDPEGALRALRHLLDLYGRMHLPEGALRAARQILELRPHDLPAYDAIVEAHLERHETDQGVRFLREAAAHCLRAERLDQALERLERVLRIVPDDARAQEERIKILCALGRTAQAVVAQIELAQLYVRKELVGKATAVLEKAVEVEPQSREAHEALADLYLARGMQEQAVQQMQRLSELLLAADEMEEAIGLYQRVLKLEPKQVEVRNRLALLYRHAGETEAALEEYFEIARLYRERDMLGRAVRVYTNVLKWVPEHLQALRMLVETLAEKDDASAAAEASLHLADVLCAQGQAGEAEEVLLQALAWGAQAEAIQHRLIALYTQAQRMDKALEHYEQLFQLFEERRDEQALRLGCEEVLRLDPDHPGAKARLAAMEQPSPKAEAGIAEPGSVGAILERAQALQAEGQFEAAVKALRSALVVEPQNAQLWRDLAEAYRRAGQEDEAVETLLRFSQQQVQQGRGEEALEAVQSAREQMPGRLDLLREQARLESQLGDGGQALGTWQEIVQRDPEAPGDWLALAELADKVGRGEQALEAFCQAAEQFTRTGHLESAQRCLRRALPLGPEDADLRLRWAALLADSGEPAESTAQQLQAAGLLQAAGAETRALEIVEQILQQQPEHVQALEQWFDLARDEEERLRTQLERALQLARCYQQQGLPGKAIEHVERLRARFSDDERVWQAQIALYRDTGAVQKAATCLLELGRQYEQQKRPDNALQCYQEAEAIVPGRPESLHAQLELYRSTADVEGQHRLLTQLADLSAERGLVGKQIAYLNEAWALAGGFAESGERLAEVYLAKGDEAEAVQVLGRLAEQYRKANAPQSARKTFERILSIQPEHSRVRFQLACDSLEQDNRQAAREQLEQIARQYPAERLPPSDPELLPVVERTLQLLFEMTGEGSFQHHLGHLYRSVQDYPAAQCAYLEALEKCPEPDVEQAIAIGRDLLHVASGESAVERRLVALYRKAGRPLEAVPLLRALWKRSLRNWEAAGGEDPVLNGPLVDRLQEIAGQLLELEPEDESVHRRMAEVFLALGRTGEAVSHWVTLGEIFTERGEKSRAAEMYRRILEAQPELLEVHVRLAEVLESQGQVKQASQEYLELGRAAVRQKQWEHAQSAFRRVADLEPRHREALGTLLEIARRRKDTEATKDLLLQLADLEGEEPAHLEAYLQLEPEDVAVRRRYILTLLAGERFEPLRPPLDILLPQYRKAKQFEAALELLDRIKERFPRQKDLYEQAIDVLQDQERQAKRQRLPAALCEEITRRLNAERLACAELLEEDGDSEAVGDLLSKVVRSDEEDDKTRRRLIDLYLAADEKSKAAQLWQQVGDIVSRRGRLDEAQAAYAEAKTLSPRSRNIRKRLATLSAERGLIEESVAEQRQLVQQAAAEKDWETAVQASEELLRHLPEDEPSLRLLAERYAKGDQPEQACQNAEALLRLLERRQDDEAILRWSSFILQLQPQRNDILQKQGAALLALGRLEEAAESLWTQAEVLRQEGHSGAEKVACVKLLELGQERMELNRQAAERLFELGMARRAQNELEHLAEQSLELHRPEEAVGIYHTLCERYAEEPKYHLALAESLVRAGQEPEALEQRLQLHALYRRQERPVEMVANLKSALDLAPGQAQLHQLLGEVLVELGNYREGVQGLLEAARLAEEEQDRRRAAQCYCSVFDIDPSHLEAHRRFHRLQSGAQLTDEEKTELLAVRRRLLSLLSEQGPSGASEMDELSERLLEDSPDDEQVLGILAEAYHSIRPEQAAHLYLRLLSGALRRKDEAVARSLLKQIRQLGSLEFEALQQLAGICQGTSLAKQILPERARLAELHAERQDREAAIEQYDLLVQDEPEHWEYCQALIENLDIAGLHGRSREEKRRLAALHRAEGRLGDAVALLESALHYEKDNPECLRQLADLFCEMDAPQRARPILSRMAELAEDTGDLGQAESCLGRLVQLFPGDGALLEQMAALLQSRGDSEVASETLLQAAQAYAEGEQISRAIALYERVAGEHPERIEVRRRLAELLRAKGLLEQALAQERAMIQWYLQRGQSDEALACYERLLEQEPRNLGLQQETAELYLELGRPDKGTDLLYQLALKYQYRELLRRAQETLQRILSIRPEHREARERLVAIYVEKGMEAEGQRELLALAGQIHSGQVACDSPARELASLGRRILELNPNHQEALESLASLLKEQGQQEPEGEPALLAEVRIALARLYISRGASNEAAASLEEAEALSPGHPQLEALQDQLRRLSRFQIPQEQFEENLRRAYEHWEHGEYGAAAQLFEQLRQAHPQDLEVLLRLAEAYTRQDHLPRAVELLESGGRQFLSERNLEAARQCFHRLLELVPERLSAHLTLAQLAQAEGNPQAALEQYLRLSDRVEEPGQLPELAAALEQARHIDPQSEEVLRRLASVYEKLERLDEAREAYRALAEGYRHRGQSEAAVEAFEQALALGPPLSAETAPQAPRETVSQCIALHLDAADTLMQGGQAGPAGEHWLKAGEVARAVGEFDSAQASFRRVLQLSSRQLEPSLLVRVYEGLAETFLQWGKPEQAAEALVSLAQDYRSRNQLEPSIHVLEKAHALAPSGRQHLEQLCQAYLEAGREEDYIRSSLLLGQVLRQRDLIGRAEAVYRSLCALPRWEAAETSPEQGEPNYRQVVDPLLHLCLDKGAKAEAVELLADLAERYLRAGRAEPAREQLEHILQLQPDHLESLERLAGLYLAEDETQRGLDLLGQLATLLENRGHSQRALETSLEMLDRDPECDAALAGVERLARALGQSRPIFESLLERFEQSFAARRAGAVLALGQTLLRLDPRAEEVRIRLPEASLWQNDPREAVAQLSALAKRYTQGLEWSRAEQCLERAVEIAPEQEDLQQLLAEARRQLAHQVESRRLEAIRQQVEEQLQGARPHQALDELDTLMACCAEDISLLEWGAALFEQAGQGQEPFVAPVKPGQRQAWLKRGLQLRLQLAEVLRGQGDTGGALNQAEQVLRLDSEDRSAMALLLDLLEESGQADRLVEQGRALAQGYGAREQWDSAVGLYRRLLERVPEETTLLGELAAALGKMNLPAEAAKVYRRQAEAFLARELFAQALSAYKQILSLDPDSPETLDALAQVYVVRGDLRGAQTYYRKLFDLHLQRGREAAAEEVLERMIELEPEQPQLRREKADLLLRAGRLTDGRHALQQLAQRYLEQELLNKAIEVWLEVVALEPDHRASRMQLVEAYQLKGQIEEAARQYLELAELWQERDGGFAEECLEKASQLAPENVEVLRRCADHQAQRGRTQECAATLGRLAGLLEAQGSLAEAVQAYERLLSIEPNATTALEQLVALHEASKRLDRAAPLLERLAELYERAEKTDQAVETYLRVAGYYGEIGLSRPGGRTVDPGALNKAAELLRRVRGLAPERLEIHERLAQVLPLLPAREEARGEFLWLSDYHCRQEDLAEARRPLERLLELWGEDLETRRRLAELHLKAGEPARAAQALSDLAEQAHAKGQMPEARSALEQALEIDANRTDLRKRLIELHEEIGSRRQALSESFSLAETLLSQGKPEEARAQCRLLQRAVRGHREHLERLAQLCVRLEDRGVAYSLYLDLAHQEIRSGRRGAAIDDAQQAQALVPEEEAPYELLTDLLLEEQRKDEAVSQLRELANLHRRKKATTKLLSTLRRLLAIDGSDTAMREELIECLSRQEDTEAVLHERTALARAYRRQERFEEALHQYHQVLGKSPLQVALIEETAQLLVELARSGDALEFYLEQAQTVERLGARPDAERLLRQAIELQEDFTPAREQLVHLYQRMERPQAALEHCEFLARLELKQGRSEAAIGWLNTIVELDPGRIDSRRELAALYQESGQVALAVSTWIGTAETLAAEGGAEAAGQLLEEARRELPEQTELTQALIRLYQKQDRLEEAAGLQEALAEVFLKEGDRGAAAEALTAALPQATEPVKVLRRLVSLYGELGNHDRQADCYRRLAEHYRRLGASKDLEQALEDLLKLEPSDLQALQALAECRFERQDAPGGCEALGRLAELYCAREQREEAVAVYRRILEHQPEESAVRDKLIALLAAGGAADEAVRELSALAKQCLEQGESGRALQALDQAVGLAPDNTLLRRQYADALRAAGQHEAALQQYFQLAKTYQSHKLGEKALEVLKAAAALWPDNLQVAERLAGLYQQEGLSRSAVQQLLKVAERQVADEDLTVARQTLARVLEIDSYCLEARQRQAEILVRLARPEEASVEFLHIARQLAEAGDLEQAQRSLEQANALPPEYREEKLRLFRDMEEQLRRTTLQKRLGQAARHVEEEQWEPAQRTYELLLVDYPDCVEATLGLARLKHRAGEPDESRSLFLEAADSYRSAGHTRQAVSALQELLQLWPQHEPALERLCELEESCGHLEEAAQLYLRLAQAREKAGRLDVAMEMCEKVLQSDPDNVAARGHVAHLLELLDRKDEAFQHRRALAKSYQQKGLAGEAIESYQKAVELAPQEAGCRAELARLLEQAGRREEAVRESLKAAEAYWQEGQRQEAGQILATVLQTNPEDVAARRAAILFAVEAEDLREANSQRKQLAAIYLKKRQPRRAVALYREALEADPKDIVIRRALAEQLEQEGLAAEAAEQYLQIGDLYNERGISGKAISFYRMAQKDSPDAAALHERIADAYLKEDLKDKAAAELLALAEAHLQQERAEEAVRAYERILDFDAGNLRVLNKLARSHEAAHNLDKAVGAYRQIVETYIERGILGKAIQTCRKALETIPHEASLRERLAELLTRRGALKEAKQEYELLLKYNPGDLRTTTLINQLNKKIAGEPDQAKPSGRPRAVKPKTASAGVPSAFFDPYMSMMSGPAPDLAAKRGQAGMEYFERKRFSRAIEELTEAINLWKKNPGGVQSPCDYFNTLGLSYLEIQQPAAAVEVLLQGIGSLSDLTEEQLLELRYSLALAYEAVGQGEEALKIWKGIYGVDRSYRDVANKILWSRIATKKKKAG